MLLPVSSGRPTGSSRPGFFFPTRYRSLWSTVAQCCVIPYYSRQQWSRWMRYEDVVTAWLMPLHAWRLRAGAEAAEIH